MARLQNELSCWREAIHNSQNHSFTSGWREASDKIQSDVGPWSFWNGEWTKQAGRSLIGGFAVSAGGACCHILSSVLIHAGPPGMLLEQTAGAVGAWMTCKPGGMGPLQNLGTDRGWCKQAISRTVIRIRLLLTVLSISQVSEVMTRLAPD